MAVIKTPVPFGVGKFWAACVNSRRKCNRTAVIATEQEEMQPASMAMIIKKNRRHQHLRRSSLGATFPKQF
ncbi:MAG TPA: hypothetical protein VE961_27900, partial [Pyrinomonadaceae bacterium]|nr:hypothetical protein [Pyrinomonadaceae bacterium]